MSSKKNVIKLPKSLTLDSVDKIWQACRDHVHDDVYLDGSDLIHTDTSLVALYTMVQDHCAEGKRCRMTGLSPRHKALFAMYKVENIL